MAIARSENQTDGPKTQVKRTNELYTPQAGDAERKAILDILGKELKSWSGLDVIFVVKYLEISNGWGWLHALPRSADGLSNYEDVSGLLQKTKGQWKLVETRPGECADDPDCFDDKRYFKNLEARFPLVPQDILPQTC
jgi:hypothetical protein